MTKKNNRLSKYEKRRAARHEAQEKEYGRDEFLFGSEEKDEWDETYDEDFEGPYDESDEGASDEDMDEAYDEHPDSGASEEYGEEYEEEAEQPEDDLPEFDPEDPDFFTRDLNPAKVQAAAYKPEDDEYAEDDDFSEDEYSEDDDFADDDYSEDDDYSDEDLYDDDYYDDDEYSEDEEYDYDRDDRAGHKRVKKHTKSRKHKGKAGFLSNMSTLDKILAAAGICVLFCAVVAGIMYSRKLSEDKQLEEFASIGSDLDEVSVIGEDGLNRMAEAKANFVAEPEQEAETEPEPDEEIVIETKSASVVMKITTIQSDLKIKFHNEETGKLIAGVPFEVTVTSDKNKTYEWTDDNKDGIIYHTDVPNGTYKISMKELDGELGEKYAKADDVSSMKVTDQIAYKKVDVSDEVKKESEVNAAAEDTKKKETAEESTLTDTVEWVESTKTLVSGSEDGYKSIDKSEIVDPSSSSSAKGSSGNKTLLVDSFGWTIPFAAGETEDDLEANLSTAAFSGTVGDPDESISVSVTGGDGNYSYSWASDNPSVASVTGSDANASVSFVGAGSAVISVTVSGTVNGESMTASASCTVDVEGSSDSTPDDDTTPEKEKKITVSLSSSSISMKVGESAVVSATVTGASSDSSVSWSSSNESVVTVSGGKLNAVGAGSAEVKAVSKEDSSKSASCQVSVTAADKPAITLAASSLSIAVGESGKVEANVTGTSDTSVVWSIKDKSIAEISSDGTVKGLKKGSTTVTAALNVDSSVTAAYSLTVTEAGTDSSSGLKDKSGNTVYIKDSNGKYTAAKASDYSTAKEFFIKLAGEAGKAVYKYTGWQTIDGFTYYYTKDNVFVTGEQVIKGAKYTFNSEGHLNSGSGVMGIDVSKWNGSIDWNAVKNAGVSYVIIRCGYRGSSTGALIEDPKFRTNASGARAAGLAVGAYFFTQAVNEVEAVEEASMAVNMCSGYGLSLPIFIDVEGAGGRADSINASTRTAVCRAFCQTVQNSGFAAGVYSNKTWFTGRVNVSQLTSYKIWLAQYAATPTYSASRYDYWQYSDKGSIPGISGNVDLNLRY